MKIQKSALLLVVILILVTVVVGGFATYVTYLTAIGEVTLRLKETAQSQARLMESVGRFDAQYSDDFPGGSRMATISQIRDAHTRYQGFGKTGEFTLAKREGDRIVFLLSHKHFDLDNPQPVPFESAYAEPMRRALKGLSGTLTGLDYRGQTVLAAHEPVDFLGLGIVAKIDLDEVRAPFLRVFLWTCLLGLVLITIAVLLFLRITGSWARALHAGEVRYRNIFNQAAVGIARVAPDGSSLEVNQRICDIVGYTREELLARTFQDITYADDLDADVELVRQVLADERAAYSLEKRYLHKSGGIVWVMLTVSLVRDARGVPEHFISVVEDISERKRTQEALLQSEEKYRLTVDATDDGLWDWNILTGEIVLSPAWTRILGKQSLPNETAGWLELIHPHDKPGVVQSLQAHMDGKTEQWKEELRLREANGHWKWVLGRGRVVKQASDGKPLRMVGTMSDITAAKQAEEQLRLAEEQFRLLLNSAAEGIYGIDLQGLCMFANSACLEMLGYASQEQVIGENMHDLMHHTRMDGEHHPLEECHIYRAIRSGEGTHITEEVFWRRNGSSFPVEYWSYPMRKDGVVTGAVVTFLDITERKLLESELKHMATHDALTGLFNRKVLERRIAEEIHRSVRYAHELSLFLLDIDYFKNINDTYGHAAGDQVLRSFAALLNKSTRGSDYAARYGGEEFVLVLPETGMVAANELAERLRNSIVELSIRLGADQVIQVTASIGVATFPEHGNSWEELIDAADTAMYRAKHAGRNQVNIA